MVRDVTWDYLRLCMATKILSVSHVFKVLEHYNNELLLNEQLVVVQIHFQMRNVL